MRPVGDHRVRRLAAATSSTTIRSGASLRRIWSGSRRLYFKPSNRTVGYFIPTPAPDRTDVPASLDLDTLLRDYKTGLSVSAGEAFDSTPANVERRIARATLANGMKLAMLSKASRGETVTATIQLRFGDDKSLAGLKPTAELTGILLMRGDAHEDPPAAAGRDAEAERAHQRHGRGGTRFGDHRHDRSESGAGAPARGGNAARARVPGRGLRSGDDSSVWRASSATAPNRPRSRRSRSAAP